MRPTGGGRTAWSLHLNDVSRDDQGDYASTEPGSGIVDFEAGAVAGRHSVDRHVYEHDGPDEPVAMIEHGAGAVLPLTAANWPGTSVFFRPAERPRGAPLSPG